jgi:intron-binding protein aquarius
MCVVELLTCWRCCIRLVGLPLWFALPAGLRAQQLAALPRIAKQWRYIEKMSQESASSSMDVEDNTPTTKRGRAKKTKAKSKAKSKATTASDAQQQQQQQQRQLHNPRHFMPKMIDLFFDILSSISNESLSNDSNIDSGTRDKIRYCEKFIEFITDLLSQLPTRRFLRIVIDSMHFHIKCKNSVLASMAAGKYVPC